ncbi:hypothetical protein [Endozoicomonas sp. Mp262]|uniref:hypothetical protein n=1 Tax=Endozoicomonas sp. Mp262 TaxID=2919499 RepID=UPI0021D90A83
MKYLFFSILISYSVFSGVVWCGPTDFYYKVYFEGNEDAIFGVMKYEGGNLRSTATSKNYQSVRIPGETGMVRMWDKLGIAAFENKEGKQYSSLKLLIEKSSQEGDQKNYTCRETYVQGFPETIYGCCLGHWFMFDPDFFDKPDQSVKQAYQGIDPEDTMAAYQQQESDDKAGLGNFKHKSADPLMVLGSEDEKGAKEIEKKAVEELENEWVYHPQQGGYSCVIKDGLWIWNHTTNTDRFLYKYSDEEQGLVFVKCDQQEYDHWLKYIAGVGSASKTTFANVSMARAPFDSKVTVPKQTAPGRAQPTVKNKIDEKLRSDLLLQLDPEATAAKWLQIGYEKDKTQSKSKGKGGELGSLQE